MIGWFYSKLEESVTKIKNKPSHDRWEADKDPVKVLHHSDNGCRIRSLIPAFFSALAVQFIGKVSLASQCDLINMTFVTLSLAC